MRLLRWRQFDQLPIQLLDVGIHLGNGQFQRVRFAFFFADKNQRQVAFGDILFEHAISGVVLFSLFDRSTLRRQRHQLTVTRQEFIGAELYGLLGELRKLAGRRLFGGLFVARLVLGSMLIGIGLAGVRHLLA